MLYSYNDVVPIETQNMWTCGRTGNNEISNEQILTNITKIFRQYDEGNLTRCCKQILK